MKEIIAILVAFLSLGPGQMPSLLAQRDALRAYREAESLREQNRCDAAVKSYNEAIRLDPENYRYYLQRGRCEYRLNNLPGARYSLEQAISLGKDEIPASVYYLLGKIYLTENPDDLDQAVKYYRMAADRETDASRRVQYQLLLVQSLVNLAQYSEAQRYLDQVAAATPHNASVMYYQGQLAAAQGKHSEAQAAYEQALRSTELREATPEDRAKYYYGLGQALEALGQEKQAMAAYEQADYGAISSLVARKIRPVTPTSQYKIAVSYYLAEEYDRSEEYLRLVLKKEPQNPEAYVLLARIADKRQQPRQAAEHLQTAASYQSDSTEQAKIYMQLAQLHADYYDYPSALIATEQAVEADIRSLGSSRLVFVKARAEYETGRYAEAVQSFERLLAMGRLDERNQARLNFMLGMAAKKAGDTEKAHEAFKNASSGPYEAAAQEEITGLRR